MLAKKSSASSGRIWVTLALLIAIILVAAYLRLTGINWDADQHLHPDERFLTGVEASLNSVESWADYFDTANSSLNPNNRGHHFFVYGTFPIFLVRYAAEWIGQTGFDQIQLIGRALSALADLGIILLVFAIGTQLFDSRVGLLAATFSALTVVQIQQSHYLTVDNFTNLFTYLTIYFAIRIAVRQPRQAEEKSKDLATFIFNPLDFVFFGIALGLAASSKISSAPLAILLPIAMLIYLTKKPTEERNPLISQAVIYLALSAAISLIVFRLFQPYAFEGPSFLNLRLNPLWVDTMKQLSGQVSGDVDWPPSMQWARRPIWFAFTNMVKWGMGLPLAIVSWSAFIWAAWRLNKRNWLSPELILWGWTFAYFLWQSVAFNPTMRYLLPVYPGLVLFGALMLVRIWDWGGEKVKKKDPAWKKWVRPFALGLTSIVVIGTAIWAFAFLQIYRTPITRLEATRWIYQNLPGPINLTIENQAGEIHQPLPYSRDFYVDVDNPFSISFAAKASGTLNEITLHQALTALQINLSTGEEQGSIVLISENRKIDWADLQAGQAVELTFPFLVESLGEHHLKIKLPDGEGGLRLESLSYSNTLDPDGQSIPLLDEAQAISLGEEFRFTFNVDETFTPDQITLALSAESPITFAPIQLALQVSETPDMGVIIAQASVSVEPLADTRQSTDLTRLTLNNPISLEEGQILYMQLSSSSDSPLTLQGAAVVNESSWDDGLPRRMDGYDGFGGIYQGDLNFEMYWNADPAKLDRFLDNLERGEYIFISSSRQWASLPRIAERFPLTTLYYRLLLDCPDHISIEACYNTAQVGDYEGKLGFDLVQVFESSPSLGPLLFNDQASEEAFTVYDHPKVFIFKKSTHYNHARVSALLSNVDFENVVNVTPKQASGTLPPNLMLPENRWESQRAGGTWSEIFNTDGWINASPWMSAVAWYLALTVLGLAVFPLVRLALPALDDNGYPFTRLSALMLISYLTWLGASLGLSFTRAWLILFSLLIVSAGLAIGYRQREALMALWKKKRSQILRVEFLFLAFFILMLLIRLGNPDLWHPGKGGEKPMDFAYFNAVLKSTSFPPYDPWFAGGYINYYYYGFVLVGSLTKLLGILPSVAYNLILPTLFAMLALGAYSIAWNLFSVWKKSTRAKSIISPGFAGLAASFSMVILSNLGNLQMIFQGFLRLGAQGDYEAEVGLLTRLMWMARGILLSILGEPFPFGLGDRYWNPTRIIPAPGETMPITEFPLFTFTYADLHAHMIALPLTLLAIAWACSAILSRAWKGQRTVSHLLWTFIFGAIAIGGLRPTNTWDFPTYLALAALAASYAIWRYWPRKKSKPAIIWLRVLAGAALLAGLSVLAYQPYADWYRQGFTSMEIWRGSHTPTGIYLIHWGAFLFFILAWMAWETRQWLANTPLSSLRKLLPYRFSIISAFFVLILALFWLSYLGVAIGWLVLPLMIWAALLLLRPGQAEIKRLTLFLIGTGLFITLMVEVIVLSGDISRMNTVFKFYVQVWVLFGLGASLAFAWTLSEFSQWLSGWRRAWQTMAAILLGSTALFFLMGVPAKIQDRMAQEAPRSLDGMGYMQAALYYDRDQELTLEQDYQAIRWLQENVAGSPVIVEAQTGEYRWGSRITINTGLPTVLGWNWHQRQQREFVPGNDVWGRASEIQEFYESSDLNLVRDFLAKYEVQYIVLGQLEQAYYPGEGMGKFEEQNGNLWDEVFRYEDTLIYRVGQKVLAGN